MTTPAPPHPRHALSPNDASGTQHGITIVHAGTEDWPTILALTTHREAAARAITAQARSDAWPSEPDTVTASDLQAGWAWAEERPDGRWVWWDHRQPPHPATPALIWDF
ncbi:hypothetical protein ACFV3R_24960 [Streptomyces sp. NPDC059740]|uniref:hypothetical protein n=1 Tax=Streptomyces sp. NPDC059740 TaxID=3346926 RepID=UPI00364C7B20